MLSTAADGNIVKEAKGKKKGQPKPDAKLRDSEEVPLDEDTEAYFEREVLPHLPDEFNYGVLRSIRGTARSASLDSSK